MEHLLKKLLEIFLMNKVAPAIGEEIKAQNQSTTVLTVLGIILLITVVSITLSYIL